MVSDYKQLTALQKAMDLVVDIYALSKHFPTDERFGLTNQIRRAAISIPSNIAEGQGRGIGRDFIRFCQIANGSRQEVETQLYCALRLGYVTADAAQPVLDLVCELGRILSGLMKSVDRQ